eukprot:sb/3473275/
MPKLTKMTWIRDFRDFAGDTSAHGVKNIFEGPTKLLKLIFLICWIICSVYATYVIMNSIITFINRPTGTKFTFLVENEQRKLGKPAVVPMPTISVCSHNKSDPDLRRGKGICSINRASGAWQIGVRLHNNPRYIIQSDLYLTAPSGERVLSVK